MYQLAGKRRNIKNWGYGNSAIKFLHTREKGNRRLSFKKMEKII